MGKKLVVYAKKGFVSDFPVRLDFSVKEPTLWQGRITAAASAKIQSIEAEKRTSSDSLGFQCVEGAHGKRGFGASNNEMP